MAKIKVPCAMSLNSEESNVQGSPCLGRVQKQDKTNSIYSRNKEGMLFKLDIVRFVCSGLQQCQVK